MEKRFFDVFRTLEVSDDDMELFEETMVTKMVSSSRHDKLHIYLTSDYIIPKDRIFAMEDAIRKQYYPNVSVFVKIIEHFNLGASYPAGAIIKQYKGSLICEAARINPAWTDLLLHADFDCGVDNVIELVLEDRMIARDMSDDMLEYLDHALNERFGMTFSVKVGFKKKEERKSVVHSRQRMIEEVRRITIQNSIQAEEDSYIKAASEAKAARAEEGELVMYDNEAGDEAVFNIYENGPIGALPGKEEKTVTRSEPKKKGRTKAPSNPDVYFGRDFTDGPINISDIYDDIGEVTIRGMVTDFEQRETLSGKQLVTFTLTDFTDSIDTKLFPRDDQLERLLENVKNGEFVLIKGDTSIDKYKNTLTIGHVYGIKKAQDFRIKREDNEALKRVELHCHTKMSDMDGVSSVSDIIDRAVRWGHDAIAITDHGVVQAFTEAFHHVKDKKLENFKVIYGMEGYVVDDEVNVAIEPGEHTTDDTFVVFDLETTGFSPTENNIIEIGAVKIEKGKITDRFSTFVNPKEPIPYKIEKLTGIDDSMVADAPFINDALTSFGKFTEGAVLVAHNARFDMGFLTAKEEAAGIVHDYSYVDTLAMARLLVPEIATFKLDSLCKFFKVSLENHHRAVDDA